MYGMQHFLSSNFRLTCWIADPYFVNDFTAFMTLHCCNIIGMRKQWNLTTFSCWILDRDPDSMLCYLWPLNSHGAESRLEHAHMRSQGSKIMARQQTQDQVAGIVKRDPYSCTLRSTLFPGLSSLFQAPPTDVLCMGWWPSYATYVGNSILWWKRTATNHATCIILKLLHRGDIYHIGRRDLILSLYPVDFGNLAW